MRYRLYPTEAQERQLLAFCGHARYVWNLAVEQLGYARAGRWCPNFAEQSRQLTEARRENPWMTETPTVVGQQALRDFNQAMTNWRNRTHRKPTWRKAGRHEGFRVTDGHGIRVEQLNRKWSRAWIPRIGWVKFRRTRALPDARSYRVTRDQAGRWHIAFAAVPDPITGPGDGSVVGVDRGVAVTLACSDGVIHCRGASAGRTGAVERRHDSPGCMPATPTGAKTGPRRPPPTWPAATTSSASRISKWRT